MPLGGHERSFAHYEGISGITAPKDDATKYYLGKKDEKELKDRLKNIKQLLLGKDQNGSLEKWVHNYNKMMDRRVMRRLLGINTCSLGFIYGPFEVGQLKDDAERLMKDIIEFYNDTFDWYRRVRGEVENSSGGNHGGSGGNHGGSGGNSGGTSVPGGAVVGAGLTAIPIETFSGLTGSEKQDLVDYLKSLGFTDEEINDIKEGRFTVNKLTLDKLSSEFESLKTNYPDFYNKLVDILGFDIYNEDGTLDQGRLALMMAMAGKGLGMEINLEKGSPFRTLLEGYAERLEAAYKNDPSIRQQFLDKYGIDPFNEDGTIDLERLALIKMMEGLKPGEYDLEAMIPKTVPSTSAPITDPPIGYPGQPAQPPITTSPPVSTTPPVTTPGGPVSTNPIQVGGISHGGGAIGSETYGAGGSSHGIVGIPGEDKPLADAAASVKDGISLAGSKLLDAINAGASGIAKQVINPAAVKLATTATKISTNKASVGIIAAAGLAAGGSLAGGGLMLSKKMHYIKFTPDDWLGLPEDVQTTVESLMVEVGFTEEELETFKNSIFKIRADELKEHTKKIEQITKNSTDLEEELLGLYHFSLVDETGKPNNYLLFLTMLIDGKNSIDSYNMYNVLNQHFENPDDSDFVYMGINMEDYIAEDDDIDNITEINDPSIEKLDDDLEPLEETTTDETTSYSSEHDTLTDKIIDDLDGDDEEAGFGQDAIGGGFDLQDDTKGPSLGGSEELSAGQEWLRSIGIDD